MSPDLPTYRRIAGELRARIQSGEFPPGSTIPTQQELADHYQVARMTTRQAIAELVNEGLVVSRPGKGTTVREIRHMVYRPQAEFEPRISAEMDRFMAQLSRDGRRPTQSIDVAVESAGPLVAARLNLNPGDPVAVRKRVRSLEGELFNINDTYYDFKLAGDTAIMNPADIPKGSNFILEEKGFFEVRAIDEFYIRMPTPEEIARLKLKAGTPVAMQLTTGYTADDRPTRCDIFIIPGDRHVILYERIHHRPEAPELSS